MKSRADKYVQSAEGKNAPGRGARGRVGRDDLLDASSLLRVLGATADEEKHWIPEEATQKEECPHRIQRFCEFLARMRRVG